jgi:ribosomal protein L11 methyltransferase
MIPYIEITFGEGSAANDVLLAALSAIGYEGFEESGERLKAFIPENLFDQDELNLVSTKQQQQFEKKVIQPANWNADWESGFQPVVVGNFVAVRAGFHTKVANVLHEIIITPKMSFGTGHHATTYLMIEEMGKIDFRGKQVMDFGTGTGILAILAEKLSATDILAIDNDDWSIENAGENVKNNYCEKIRLLKANDASAIKSFDIILANINKNVILDNLEVLATQLNPGGVLILSGLLAEDENEIGEAAGQRQLRSLEKNIKDNWLCLRFER